MIGTPFVGVGRRISGPERDPSHEPLRLVVAELVIDAAHRSVGPMAEPGVDHPLRNARVVAMCLEEVP